jgi:hypothetical protein
MKSAVDQSLIPFAIAGGKGQRHHQGVSEQMHHSISEHPGSLFSWARSVPLSRRRKICRGGIFGGKIKNNHDERMEPCETFMRFRIRTVFFQYRAVSLRNTFGDLNSKSINSHSAAKREKRK